MRLLVPTIDYRTRRFYNLCSNIDTIISMVPIPHMAGVRTLTILHSAVIEYRNRCEALGQEILTRV